MNGGKHDRNAPWETSSAEGESSRLVADVYRVRVGKAGEEAPESWQAVWTRVNECLRAFVVNLFATPVDALRAARGVIDGFARISRGLSETPDAINRRIANGRALADHHEDQMQADAAAHPLPAPDTAAATEALATLQKTLDGIRARGHEATVVRQQDGSFLVITTPAQFATQAVEVARIALKEAAAPAAVVEAVTGSVAVTLNDVTMTAAGPTGSVPVSAGGPLEAAAPSTSAPAGVSGEKDPGPASKRKRAGGSQEEEAIEQR